MRGGRMLLPLARANHDFLNGPCLLRVRKEAGREADDKDPRKNAVEPVLIGKSQAGGCSKVHESEK